MPPHLACYLIKAMVIRDGKFQNWPFLHRLGAILWYYCEDMHLDFSVISWTFS